jgi:Domain of unknown function (DUF4160)
MYHGEIQHLGRPHFHARYADGEASIEIETLGVLAGGLPQRALRLVKEWGWSTGTSCEITGRAPAAMSRCSRLSRSAERLRFPACEALRF